MVLRTRIPNESRAMRPLTRRVFYFSLRVAKALLNRLFDFLQFPVLKPSNWDLGFSLRVCGRILENTKRFRIRRVLAGWFHNFQGSCSSYRVSSPPPR